MKNTYQHCFPNPIAYLYYTELNDGLYQVKTNTNGVITIETTKTLRAETVDNAYIVLIDFPIEFIGLIAQYVKDNVIKDGSIQKEKLDDAEYTYFSPSDISSFILKNSSTFNDYRHIYKYNLWRYIGA
jgi:hypothetical protein